MPNTIEYTTSTEALKRKLAEYLNYPAEERPAFIGFFDYLDVGWMLKQIALLEQERESEAETRREALRERDDARDQLRWAKARIAELETNRVVQLEADIRAYRANLQATINQSNFLLESRSST